MTGVVSLYTVADLVLKTRAGFSLEHSSSISRRVVSMHERGFIQTTCIHLHVAFSTGSKHGTTLCLV